MSEEREQKVAEVVQNFRALESAPAGGVSVSLPGAPEGMPVFSGEAGAFTPEVVDILRELRAMTQAPEDRVILIEAYKRFQEEESYS